MHIIGAKKGQATKPYIMPDNMQSGNEVGIVYGLGEGEILGLVDGGKSIYLDGTPLINDNGGENFGGVSWEMRTGTIDQEHLHGFPAVENETSVNVELRHDRAFVRQLRNTKLSAVVIRLGFGAIFTAKDNGDRVGHTIEYAIDVQTDGGVWREVLATKFSGKASQGYKRSHRIDLPTAKNNWTIRVRRLTANKDSEMVGDRMTIDALTEVIDAKLRYPCTALIGLRFNAESFNNIPKFAAECHGMIIQVPTNYDPVARTYAGLWDGTFKLAYSNNPAWIYYDLCTARRYALGDRLIGHLDKWSLYRVAQYCDEMVDDGRGGREPRYACNVYLQQREDAYKILQNIAGIFHALTYWDGEQIIVDADLPKDVLYTFSRANIIGDFEYSGTANYARHTQIKVAYDDPDNEYKTTYEIVPDLQAIAKYGVKTLDMSAFGCTSQAQAIRLGKWALLSEALETQTVTFSVGLDGYLPHVGSVIAVSDHVLAGRDNGGRVQAIDGNIIALDRAITKPLASGDMLMINGNDGVTETRTITAINGNKITVQSAFERAEVDAVWVMDSTDLQTLKLRVMSIVQSEPAKFTITGVEYNPDKFAAAEIDIRALPKPVSVIPTAVISAPETVTISQSVRVEQGVSITKLSIDWSQVIGAVAYRVEWRTDDNAWIALPKTASQSIDIDNVYSGNYQARVRAIDAFDNESLATSSQITQITGKVGKPPRLARLTATGKLFGMDLTWSFNAGSDDTAYTEIQVSPDSRSNIATLGTFAYPTDKHTINGLQGNLTQFYRARIVDKLGNMSDWTAWTSGTTEAQADKVLSLLTGQITASQLHQDLSTPIGKIGGIESSVNSLQQAISSTASNLDALNRSISDANSRITQAQSELDSAVSEIGTNKVNIASAIRDISALQSADSQINTQINGLQSNYNSLSASISAINTTIARDKESLTQQINQAQATADNTASQLSSVQQALASETQARTTAIDALTARLSNSGNLVGNVTRGQFWYVQSNAPANHNQYSLTDFIAIKPNTNYVIQATNGALRYLHIAYFNATRQLITSQVAIGATAQSHYQLKHATASFIRFSYQHTMTDGVVMTQSDAFASIDSVRDAMTTADSALSRRIDTLDASYKQADTTLNASITAEQQARASADNALSQRITALDTAYKSADTQANAKIATLEQSITDKDSAMARRVDTLQASYNTLNSTKASTASVTAEAQARSTADNALSQRIDNLNSDYQSNKASVTSQLRTLSDADSATAQRLDAMSSQFDSLSVGGRNYLTKASFGTWQNGTWQDYRFTIDNKNLAGSMFRRVEAIEEGADVVFSFKIAKKSGRITSIGGHTYSLSHHQVYIDGVLVGDNFNASVAYPDDLDVHHIVIKARDYFTTATNDKALYIQPNRGSNGYADVYSCEIWDCKLERGTIATDWTPAPEDIDAQFVQTNANISTLQQTVTNADNALSSRIDSLSSDYNSNKSSVASQLKTLSDKDTATASQLSSLQASVSTAQSTANTATNKADNAQATANNALSRANTANSAIATEQSARADADTALSQRISQLDSAYKSADSALSSRVATAERSITTANQAIAQTQQTLTARIDGLSVGGRNLIANSQADNIVNGTRRYHTYLLTSDINEPFVFSAKVKDVVSNNGNKLTVAITHNSNTNNNIEQRQDIAIVNDMIVVKFAQPAKPINALLVYANSGGWGGSATGSVTYYNVKAERGTVATDWTPAPEDVDSATSGVQANLDEFKTAQASKDNATAQSISTLQTTVNGQTASIQQHSQSINGLSAQWTLKAESNGIVSGIGLASSNGVSDFAVRANKFYVVPPTGTTKTPLFSVLTTTTTVGGVSVPAGVYLSNAYIQNGTITNAKIANGAITTAKIGNAQIGNAQIANGAIDSAKIGDAAITTAKIGIAQVDTLQIAGQAVIVPRFQQTDWFHQYQADVWHTVFQFSLNTQGSAASLFFGWKKIVVSAWHQTSVQISLQIKRDDVILYEEDMSFPYAWQTAINNYSSPPIFDFNPPDNAVYSVNLMYRGDRPTVSLEGVRILGLGMKR